MFGSAFSTNAKEKNTLLREKVAQDRNGRPTRDPEKALNEKGVANLLPIGGGFKGYGIMMLIEVLTGSLIRSLMSTQQRSGWNPEEYGCFMIAIDISGFTDLDRFKADVGKMGDTIRGLESAQGDRKVSVPGDRGHEKVKKAMESAEIEVDEKIIAELKRLAGGGHAVNR